MARKKKGQKKTDDQAGGDASAGHPEAPGPSTAPQGAGDTPQTQGKSLGTQYQPQQRGQGAQQETKTQQGQQPRRQEQKGSPEEAHPPQQGAWQSKGKQQQRPSHEPTQLQGQGAWQTTGKQPKRPSPEQTQPQQPVQGAWQTGKQQQRTAPGQTQPQQQRTSPGQPQQQGQGAWQPAGKQQQRTSPEQTQQQGQGAWQSAGKQQQRTSPEQSQQQGQGAWQSAGKQQQRTSPEQSQQQGQGAWQTTGKQQQRTSPEQPQQQGQGAWQTTGKQQQRTSPEQPQQQGQGAWQTTGKQQQRTSPEQPQQQGQGAWQTTGKQQQRTSPEQPQQQGQGAWQTTGKQQQRPSPEQTQPQQQGQGAWQTTGKQQQQRIPQQQGAWQRGAPQGGAPQQGPGAWPRGQQQQQPRPSQDRPPQQQQQGPQAVVQYGSDLPAEMQKLSTSGRLGGTQGRKIQVETNYLSIDFGKLPKAYHYDVQINPETPKRWLRDVFEQFRQKCFPKSHPAFDGKRNAYSPYELIKPNQVLTEEIELEIPHETKKKLYKLSFQFATEVDLSPLRNMKMNSSQQALQCVEIVLRSAPTMKCIQAGRSFYSKPPSIIKLGEGMEMYYGFYQTVVRGWKPFFNVDVAHKAFPIKMNIIPLIAELASDWRTTVAPEDLKNQELNDNITEKLSKHLKTLRIIYQIPGMKREYRVNGLGKPPRKNMFSVDGKTMSIEEYFMKKKNIRLNYPLMPTLWVGSVARQDKILLPAELCTVVENQTVNRKMTENQTTAMIKVAATSTQVRKDKIMNSLRATRHNEDACIREFGFRINNDFEKVEARVLQPPALEYAGGMTSMPSKGVWRQDNYKFFRGADMPTWIIISTTGNLNKECSSLANLISSHGVRNGMRLSPTAGRFDFLQSRYPNQRDVLGILERYHNKFDLIFVIIPDSGPLYSFVKKAAEIHLNCLTQCIKRKTLMKMNASTVGNILLKVNSKLSGTNHCLKFKPPVLNEPCMIMGADVTHPSPDSTNIPSVVAVTASHDPKAMFGYNMCCRLQLPTVEIIEDLEEITKEHLTYFYQMNNGQRPYKIIFFRDGVSEGQFAEVKQKELTAIRRACSRMNSDYQPKITFIVVQKRHHTRFFPNKNDTEDRNCNVPAGTCVDTVITSPNVQDFYLVSHASIQGVAKPTKYSTLWDDNDLSYDEVEQLAYYLCHLFSRCNRSVSYPAPTYYAHLGAARAKVYIESEQINFENLRQEQRKLKNDKIRKDKPMFFV